MFDCNIALIDDDCFHTEMLRHILNIYERNHYQVKFSIHTFQKIPELFDTEPMHAFHIALLSDSYSEHREAIDRLRRLNASVFVVVAVSSPEFMWELLEENASQNNIFAYLKKPIIYSNLETLLDRILPLLYVRTYLAPTEDSITIRKDGIPHNLSLSNILYFEKYRNRMNIYTAAHCYHNYLTVRDLKKKLNPDTFIQIHQGCIVNWNYVHDVTKETLYVGEHRLSISHSYMRAVMQQQLLYPK